jgi:hypothetical protein
MKTAETKKARQAPGLPCRAAGLPADVVVMVPRAVMVVMRIGRGDRTGQHGESEKTEQSVLHCTVPPVAALIAALMRSVHAGETLSTGARVAL